MSPKNRDFYLGIVPRVLFEIFVTMTTEMLFSKGVCCAEDAYHAIIFENLVDGLGYTSTVLDTRVSFSPIFC